MRGKRVLVFNDGIPLFGGLLKSLRAAGVEVITAQKPAAALWYVDGEPLDAVVVLVEGAPPSVPALVARVRASRLNGATPVSVVTETLDAGTVKRLAALGVSGIMLARAGVDEIVHRLAAALAPSRPGDRYDVRVINCFLSAARTVLAFYVTPLEIGKPAIKQRTDAAGVVTAVIAFSMGGQLGSLSVSFDRPFVDALGAKMLGDGPALDDPGGADLAGEMANQILGKAKANLEQVGIAVSMGLPDIVTGAQHVRHAVDNPALAIPITTAGAACVVEFAVGRSVTANGAPASDAKPGAEVEIFEGNEAAR